MGLMAVLGAVDELGSSSLVEGTAQILSPMRKNNTR